MPATDILTRADPDRVPVVRVDRDAADRIGIFVIEYRRPGRATVLGLPDATTANADVPGAGVRLIDHDVGDAPGHERRPDAAKFKSGKRGFIEARFRRFVMLGQYQQRYQQNNQACSNDSIHDFPRLSDVLFVTGRPLTHAGATTTLHSMKRYKTVHDYI
jgi:hypothetical protein